VVGYLFILFNFEINMSHPIPGHDYEEQTLEDCVPKQEEQDFTEEDPEDFSNSNIEDYGL